MTKTIFLALLAATACAVDPAASSAESLSGGSSSMETSGGWTTCSTSGSNCGGANGTGTPVQSTFTPGTFGGRTNAARIWIGGNVSYGTAYWYKKTGDPGFLATTFEYTTDFEIPAAASYQAIEWDGQEVRDRLVYNFGLQANPTIQQWRIFNYAAGRWEDSGIPWNGLTQGVWHTLHAHFHVAGSDVTTDYVEIDGQKHVPTKNAVHVAVYKSSYTGANVSMGLQLDQHKTGASYEVYYDNVSIAFGNGGTTPPPPSSCAAPTILEPTSNQSVGPSIQLRASAPPCIGAIKCYVDGNAAPVASASTNALDQWVSVTMGSHQVQCNGWDSSGTAHASAAVSFVRTY